MKKGVSMFVFFGIIILTSSYMITACDLTTAPDIDGSAYIISTCSDLQQIKYCSNTANYVLNNNINCDGESFRPLFSGDSFNGKFKGNGHVILNLFIEDKGEKSGLFSEIGINGKVENLVLENISVIGGQGNTGGLAGYNKGVIINSHIVNLGFDIAGKTNENGIIATSWNNIGGLVGTNEGTIIDSSISGGIVQGGKNVGGLVGYNKILNELMTLHDLDDALLAGAADYKLYNSLGNDHFLGHIVNSYSSTRVEGSESVGGLVGENDRHVHNSFSSGANPANLYSLSYPQRIIGNNKTGGLVGENVGQIYDSYSFLKTLSGNKIGGLVGYNEIGRIYNSFEKDVSLSGTCAGNLVGAFGCFYGRISESKNFDNSNGCINSEASCIIDIEKCTTTFNEPEDCGNNQILSDYAYDGFFGGLLNINDPDGVVWKRYDVVDGSIPILSWMGCGDGIKNSGYETCDDGNIVDGDGCNSQCKIEPGAITKKINGQCNPHLNGLPFADRTTLNNAIMVYFGLCSEGTATVISGNGPWTWKCEGKNSGTTDSCSTLAKENTENCGLAQDKEYETEEEVKTAGLCKPGITASNFHQYGETKWLWDCNKNLINSKCEATKIAQTTTCSGEGGICEWSPCGEGKIGLGNLDCGFWKICCKTADVNDICGTDKYTCVEGSLTNTGDNGDYWTWKCGGIDCSVSKSVPNNLCDGEYTAGEICDGGDNCNEDCTCPDEFPIRDMKGGCVNTLTEGYCTWKGISEGDCDSGETQTITYEANDPYTLENIDGECAREPETYLCPALLPVFSLLNIVIALIIISGIYFVIEGKKKR